MGQQIVGKSEGRFVGSAFETEGVIGIEGVRVVGEVSHFPVCGIEFVRVADESSEFEVEFERNGGNI